MLKKTFTLIELLLSIIIFSIGILTLFQVANYFLQNTEKIKYKSQATILANEAINLLYLLKETNIKRQAIWNCIKFNSNLECKKTLKDIQYLQISYNPSKTNENNIGDSIIKIKETTNNFQDNKLYLQNININGKNIKFYNYNSNGKETIYSRYIKLNKVYSAPDNNYLEKEKILKISSIVQYKKGPITGEIKLETFLGKY